MPVGRSVTAIRLVTDYTPQRQPQIIYLPLKVAAHADDLPTPRQVRTIISIVPGPVKHVVCYMIRLQFSINTCLYLISDMIVDNKKSELMLMRRATASV